MNRGCLSIVSSLISFISVLWFSVYKSFSGGLSDQTEKLPGGTQGSSMLFKLCVPTLIGEITFKGKKFHPQPPTPNPAKSEAFVKLEGENWAMFSQEAKVSKKLKSQHKIIYSFSFRCTAILPRNVWNGKGPWLFPASLVTFLPSVAPSFLFQQLDPRQGIWLKKVQDGQPVPVQL